MPASGRRSLSSPRVVVDTTRFQARMRQIRRMTPAARQEALGEVVGLVSRVAQATLRHDTNRNRRGWAMAHNAADAALRGALGGPVPVPALTASRRAKSNLARLVKRKTYLQRLLRSWYGDSGAGPTTRKPDRWHGKLVAALRKVEEQLQNYDEYSLIIGPRASAGLSAWANILRHKVYGGTSRIVQHGERTLVTLHNLEPHSSIVESRDRDWRAALRLARMAGLARISKAFVRRLASESSGRGGGFPRRGTR